MISTRDSTRLNSGSPVMSAAAESRRQDRALVLTRLRLWAKIPADVRGIFMLNKLSPAMFARCSQP